MKTVGDFIDEIDEALMKYRSTHASDPKHMILSMEHRQAIKHYFWNPEQRPWADIETYVGIPVVNAEDSIILCGER